MAGVIGTSNKDPDVLPRAGRISAASLCFTPLRTVSVLTITRTDSEKKGLEFGALLKYINH